MTPQPRKLFNFINNRRGEYKPSPRFKEIPKGIRLSFKVSRCIQALTERGQFNHSKKGARHRIIPAKSNDFSLPLLGCIAAGSPMEAITDEQKINWGALFKGNNHFILEVKGDSMIEENIFDGELVIYKYIERVEEGEIVAVLIDQLEATLKRISYQLKDMITLVPANSNLKPKAYPSYRVQIQRIFIATLRFKK